MTETVRDLDETALLARIVPLLPRGGATLVGPGDDAAVVAAPDGRYVVSTDVLVEDHHFRRRWSTGYDVGVRAAAQNLADVAAMGGRPTALVVGLAMPGDLEVAWVEDLARGLAHACAPVGAAVVGGDLSGGPVVMVSVAVHGDLGGAPPVLRSGARPGDVVAHAGVRGWSAAGLALLEAGVVSAADGVPGAPGPLAPFVAGFLRPTPPLAAGPAAAAAGATAMLDVSDGLLRDAGRIAAASGVVVDLDGEALAACADRLLPAAKALEAAAALEDAAALAGTEATGAAGTGNAPRGGASGIGGAPRGAASGSVGAPRGAASGSVRERAMGWVLGGGEDHGLLATFPAGAPLPEGFTRIGAVRETAPRVTGARGPGARVTVDGREPQAPRGWDHFGA